MRARIAVEATFEKASVIGFKERQAGVEQLTLRDDDDVEALRECITTENLSNQTFRSISLYCPTQLSGCRDAQPRDALVVGRDEHRAVAASDSRSAVIDLLVLSASTNPLF